MPNLTETAFYTRKGAKWFVYFLIGYIVMHFVLTLSIAIYKQLNPPPPLLPSMGFGPLPDIVFPSTGGGDYQYQLQTPSGSFPVFADRAKVYYMPYQRANLLAPDQAKNQAKQMQFLNEESQIAADTFEWSKEIPAKLSLQINYVNGSFKLSYLWQADSSLLMNKQLPGRDQSLQMAEQYFNTLGLANSDIDFSNGTVSYLKASANKLVPAISLSEADFVKLDFFRGDIDTDKVLTPEPDKGIISIVLSGTPTAEKQFISIDYNYFPINYYQPETYPLKPIAQAWEELKKGQGYIAQGSTVSKEVIIRRITLAYFDSRQAQQFLQPIYVFSGDNNANENFIAYVGAATNTLPKDKKYSKTREVVAPTVPEGSNNSQGGITIKN